MRSKWSSWFPFFLGLLFLLLIGNKFFFKSSPPKDPLINNSSGEWHSPDINLLPHTSEGELIRYGRDLIVNTSVYFGPRGIVAQITNGMNCQNCHVEAGTRAFGNSFAGVAANYPQQRPRSGIVESIAFRINDCMMRSMNGQAIDSQSREMKAMLAYFEWVGKDVKRGVKPAGSGINEIPFINRAADPEKGRIVYETTCRRCHGRNGEGVFFPDSTEYQYPPLWGPDSYNTGAGLYRISRFAAFVKYNMPFASEHLPPQLTDEEAWDVAAFVNSQPRSEKKFPNDFPKLETKPVDYPFGPYTDQFSEHQHKYGPYQPIKEAREKAKTIEK